KNIVRNRVEKYFFDTSPTGQTVDKSTFIEGGDFITLLNFIWLSSSMLKDLLVLDFHYCCL
ncbi:hypothetical protein ACFWGC_29740, partial [Cytobacillus pseudoceanisediminis]|uniref:hypothetical protein n=1 Tax=Cytobacillus pseudoceanisediminis TaxID=3051614 RepID=UPI00366572C2